MRWRTDLGRARVRGAGAAGDVMCATPASGDLEVLGARDGRLVARVPLGGPSAGAVAAANGRIVFGIGAEPFLPGGEPVCV